MNNANDNSMTFKELYINEMDSITVEPQLVDGLIADLQAVKPRRFRRMTAVSAVAAAVCLVVIGGVIAANVLDLPDFGNLGSNSGTVLNPLSPANNAPSGNAGDSEADNFGDASFNQNGGGAENEGHPDSYNAAGNGGNSPSLEAPGNAPEMPGNAPPMLANPGSPGSPGNAPPPPGITDGDGGSRNGTDTATNAIVDPKDSVDETRNSAVLAIFEAIRELIVRLFNA